MRYRQWVDSSDGQWLTPRFYWPKNAGLHPATWKLLSSCQFLVHRSFQSLTLAQYDPTSLLGTRAAKPTRISRGTSGKCSGMFGRAFCFFSRFALWELFVLETKKMIWTWTSVKPLWMTCKWERIEVEKTFWTQSRNEAKFSFNFIDLKVLRCFKLSHSTDGWR